MKKKKYIALTLMLSLFCITKTHASCTQEEKIEFNKIEDEYKIVQEINKENKTYTLKLIRTNPNMYDYVFYISGELICNDINETTAECYNFTPGTYRIEIKGQTNTCNDVLKEISLKLPKYNEYSENPLCEGIEEFVLCQPTYEKEIDYETFVSRVNTYKKTKQEKIENEIKQQSPQNDNKIINNIISYVKENLIQIIIITIFIVLLIISIVVTINQAKKSRRLE